MQKNDLLAQLTNAKNNFVLGMAGASLLIDRKASAALETHSVSFGQFSLPLDQVATLMRSSADREIAIKEFILGLYRALLKESFGLISTYASATEQEPTFKGADHYHFWRMVRNSISHDAHWRFSRFDLSLLPLEWRGVRMKADMQDQPFRIDFLGYDGMFQLYLDMAEFAETSLI